MLSIVQDDQNKILPLVEEKQNEAQQSVQIQQKVISKVGKDELLKKKEKRNRKFFLKRSYALIVVCKQTGDIEFVNGTELLHVEIMQGGHIPLNPYSIKDISSEIYNNDFECRQANIISSLNGASFGIAKRAKQLQVKKNQKSYPQIQQPQLHQQNQVYLPKGQKVETFNVQQFEPQNQIIIKQIEEAKKMLENQHFLFKYILK